MALTQPPGPAGPRLGPTRARVLALVQEVGDPLTAAELADRLAVHPNTVRFHLDALVRGGLVVRHDEGSGRAGRPTARFAAAAGAPPGALPGARRSYGVLADILVSQLAAAPHAAAVAEEAGRSWAGHLLPAERADREKVAPPDGAAAAAGADGVLEAADALARSLDRIGFDNHRAGDERQPRLEVTACPFLELARDHRDVVCAVHLGLMRGLLERSPAPLSVERLEPLVSPGRCVARLRAEPAAAQAG